MLQLWTEYLPSSVITFVEYDATCSEKWRSFVEEKGHGKLYVGDQANVTFLESIIADQAGNQFDVIIDDGGHRMHQQRLTLKHLWQLVKPGGVFIMEDLLTSYDPGYGGGAKGKAGTMIDMQKDILDGLHCEFQIDCTPVLPGLLDMDCFKEACVMMKEDTQ